MTAEIFLSSFCGCLFALAFVAVATFGVMKWRIRRFMAMNAKEIAQHAQRDMSPDEMASMREFAQQFRPRDDREPSERAP